MAEAVQLTTPRPGTSTYSLSTVHLDWRGGRIDVELLGDQGDVVRIAWAESAREPARELMRALNTADLSQKSLVRRVLERAVADGKLPAGSVVGTPD